MKQVVIENPIINSAFAEPQRHFRFDDDGITSDIVNTRRKSHYFIPIAKPKKQDKQLELIVSHFNTLSTGQRFVQLVSDEGAKCDRR